MIKYSEKDLIRRKKFRLIIFATYLFGVVLGTRYYAEYDSILGIILTLGCALFLSQLIISYENLLEEKDVIKNNGGGLG